MNDSQSLSAGRPFGDRPIGYHSSIMLERFLNFGRRIIPRPIFKFCQPFYHISLAYLGALIYGFPSKKLMVIGVTGTKGKTTVCNLITDILNYVGLKTGMTSTVNFKLGQKTWINQTKQTMLGRFGLQKMLAQMVKEDCQYAVIETSSEGLAQYRHLAIDYQVAILTNLTPEHIESHGSFEAYRQAKLKLFKKVAQKKHGLGIYNLDDENVEYFLRLPIEKKYGYTLKENFQFDQAISYLTTSNFQLDYQLSITNYELTPQGTKFTANGVDFEMPLIGQFNIGNAAAAICLALSQGLAMEQIKEALTKIKPIPGRLEIIDQGQDFTVIVDYAHEPASLKQVYQTLKIFQPQKVIALLGAQGGGRDKRKRLLLGQLANQYADYVIVTNEDPYDEPPFQIIQEVMAGVLKDSQKKLGENAWAILDRRQAIRKALSLAHRGDCVILTGKGGEVWMCVENNKKIPWSEAEIVREELAALR